MFHKVEQLRSIGKFRDFNAVGDVAFKPMTLIYAENGSGKTTLAAIFRSIASNNPVLLSKRISTNNAQPQLARIFHRNDLNNPGTQTTLTFNNGAWSASIGNVEIFDSHFINDNIYSGFQFTDDHKKQLHHFIVGTQGILLKQQIEQNKEQKSNLRVQINTNEQTVIRNVGNGLTDQNLADFIAIAPAAANDIATKIQTAQTNLNNARQNSVIQTFNFLQNVSVVNVPIAFQEIVTDLATTIGAIQDAALAAVFTTHCADLRVNNINQPESWLRLGFEYQNEKARKGESLSCPYCTQPINNALDVIRAYSQQFNDMFNALLNRLTTNLAAIQRVNVDNLLQGQINTITANRDRLNMWLPLISNEIVPLNDNVIGDITPLRTALQNAIAAISTKLQNPSVVVDSDSLIDIQNNIQTVNQRLTAYNTTITEINRVANAFRNTIQTEQNAQQQLLSLRRIEARFQQGNQDLISQILSDRQTLLGLEQAYGVLVQQEEQDSQNFLNQYGTRINHYLGTVFHTPFAIRAMQHLRPAGRAIESKVGYELTIHGQAISFDTSQANSVKECLSDGDKSTIALAFFLAKLDLDPNKSDKIVVFDDPLASFDTHRRGYTIDILKTLLADVKQVIVLSHDQHFLYDIYAGTDSAQRKVLGIMVNALQHSSSIQLLDLNDLVDTAYFRHLKILTRFLSTPTIADRDYVCSLIRNVLEANLKFKFYREINGIPQNQRTFGRIITTLENGNVVFRVAADTVDTYRRLKLLNSISWRAHHGDPMPEQVQNGYDHNNMSVGELTNYVTDTLVLLNDKI